LCPEAVEGRYSLKKTVGESFSLIQKALTELNLKNLKMKRLVPSSYILAEYKAGWLDKRQIEFILQQKKTQTEVSIKFFYPSLDGWESMVGKKEIGAFRAQEKLEKTRTERLFEELKSRIGATPVTEVEEEKRVREKEIIKEREVIVKIRCPHCRNTYDETLDRCPHCNAPRP